MPAQGNALGKMHNKDKALKVRPHVVAPLQGLVPFFGAIPRALPWAGMVRTFGARMMLVAKTLNTFQRC